ncbi:excinuclease ABC subunit UvrA [Candidatus Chloroploca sp. Khr17]|uniref:excinuclease ABC subunit UvrA n=1 Tax=Candidatus Chloroploca sp. Khr17 TaxID=2496869 RepID=UPI001F0FBB26|nr:excinuclease ABC subunit UvrA [Candidatus Chloroploca sp. Khr17]
MSWIIVRGAREHNLKNIDVRLPRNQLVVITGLSGSGKSTLAFDTIFAEGQRRYVESLSVAARQFLGQLAKPDVDAIEGLSPAIAIDQHSGSRHPRSTVGTVTEIYDFLRLLFARTGQPHCPQCGLPLIRHSVQEMVDAILTLPEASRLLLLAPLIAQRTGDHVLVFDEMRRRGFVRVRVNGDVRDLDEVITLDPQLSHTIEVVVDRLIVRHPPTNVARPRADQLAEHPDRVRITDSVETALKLTAGRLLVHTLNGATLSFSQAYACPDHGSINLFNLEPRHFSFNSPHGACPTCDGLGQIAERDLGAHRDHALPASTLPDELPADQEEADEAALLNGAFQICPSCHGDRLRAEVRAVTFADQTLPNINRMPITEALAWTQRILMLVEEKPPTSPADHPSTDADPAPTEAGTAPTTLTTRQRLIAAPLLKDVVERLAFLVDVGLGYLTLDRAATTLSGGESQRIRLATQVGAGLSGVIYVLDEPSTGLHPRDHERLLRTLIRLRDLGNSVLVVEHDEATIRAADWIVDIGPGAGPQGGELIVSGTLETVLAEPRSLTGQYLSGKRQVPRPTQRRPGNGRFLTIRGCRENNLHDLDVTVPLGCLVVVTGVSGSGKSSLVMDTLYPRLAQELHGAQGRVGLHTSLEGLAAIDKVVAIDQHPIGRTPRSNPATYSRVFDPMRNLFAATTEARARGYDASRFSFNARGGRCEACSGEGLIRVEMQFLPDLFVPCDRCGGARYNRETLDIRYRDQTIADVLAMTVAEGAEFFARVPAIAERLQTLLDVGVGYIRLGQPANTLSGGEAQRIKLATELARRATGRTLYILDEPTSGLHIADIERLLSILHRLVDAGNTVMVIEHNLDVILHADWVLDLGPEGGSGGGQLVAAGPPETVMQVTTSPTGTYLARHHASLINQG